MAQTNDLSPPIDATVENELIGFDFGPILGLGESISAVTLMRCYVSAGSDPNPSARLIGSPNIIYSNATGQKASAVGQLVGNMLAGVKYGLQCVVATTGGQELSLWGHLSCVSPT